MKTIINLFGAPNSGKSTTAYKLCGLMKELKYDVELAPEWAKILTWQNRQECLKNQITIFGRQYEAICIPKTEYIVTDSPLLLTLLYNQGSSTLNELALECHYSFKNINILLLLGDTYNPKGRNQNFEESLTLQNQLINILYWNNIKFSENINYIYDCINKRNLHELIM